MDKKKARIEIRDLNVDLDELQKKDPEILKKIRGGFGPVQPAGISGPICGGASGHFRLSAACSGAPAGGAIIIPPCK